MSKNLVVRHVTQPCPCMTTSIIIKITRHIFRRLHNIVITDLNYRFTGNLHVHVFSTYETEIMTTSKDFTTCHIDTGRCCNEEM